MNASVISLATDLAAQTIQSDKRAMMVLLVCLHHHFFIFYFLLEGKLVTTSSAIGNFLSYNYYIK